MPRQRSGASRWIRRFAVPVIVAWVAFVAAVSIVIPPLEAVGQMRAVSMNPSYAPSVTAMKRIGEVFGEFRSDSSVTIVVEGHQPLDAEAHDFYESVVRQLNADHDHIEFVQDLWSDPLTAAGVQSEDGMAAYVQVYLVGNQGEPLANESVRAVQEIVSGTLAPPGVQAFVTGPAALAADELEAGDRSAAIIVILTFVVITTMLVLVYRSIGTVLIVLAMVLLTLQAARGVVALLAYHHVFGLTTFVTNLLVTLTIAAATDYAIFLVGRYQEARTAGQDPETAYNIMFRGTTHVIIASGSTIAGATLCLHFTRLPYFQTLGVPLAAGMVVAVCAAVTLGPATVAVATRFGRLEPRRAMRIRGWRKVGALVVRWPAPVLLATVAVSLIGLLTLSGYRTNYNERNYVPDTLPAMAGDAAAERHFSAARMNQEFLLVEADRDVRNPADFLVLDKIAKAVARLPGISRVQAITRPDGKPLKFSTLPAQLSMTGAPQALNEAHLRRLTGGAQQQIEDVTATIDTLTRMQALIAQTAEVTHSMVAKTHQMVSDVAALRDHLGDFDDFVRPLRNYLYWEPHCYNIPACWSMRSVFDALDGADTLSTDAQALLAELDRFDELTPALLGQLPGQIETLRNTRNLLSQSTSTQQGVQDHGDAMARGQTAMGRAFNDANNDDTFYLPPETFDNPDFAKGMRNFVSPDGHAIRFIVTHDGDPLTAEGIERIERVKLAAREAMKGTPLEGSKVSLAGTASVFKDMRDGNVYDLWVAGLSAMSLIFIIMLVITRSLVAAAVIVGTVALSLGAAFGLSMLVWQHIIGLDLHFMVMAMALIVLLAVGADYNLLLVSRFREEIHAGLKTGAIRAMGGTGSVVTSAGLVFAFTMMSMAVSELRVVAQIGTTIGLGLLFDTLVIRSFMTPAIAALLGRWFWWPQVVRSRPAPSPWPRPPIEL
ncbi:RND family transporter [Mycolicibacterium brumae]|uniref:MMPL/RND family transporter n=1 Tax=Mycolicibacterium brumae TaxID=85968 RepID=UPI000FFAB1B8|nr:MMPL family transporter [Mycolicibacterium brumae]RWA21660.1 hypothetical protein MBRU_14385 [Mycolicibacterium brumae DSM 44177]